jgi:MFS family permease
LPEVRLAALDNVLPPGVTRGAGDPSAMPAGSYQTTSPRPPKRWRVAILLSLLAGISFVDKFVMAILAQPIAHDLSLSDSQIGLLIGPAFAILFALSGLPVAFLVDTRNRKRLVLAGVLIWSIMTILSGFTHQFALLTLMRSGVAIGEAVLAPAAFSMIADLFDGEERALPVTIFMVMTAAMGVGSMAIGGLAMMVATMLSPVVGAAPWRLALMMVGVPGLLVASCFHLLVKEPERRERPPAHAVNMRAFVRELVSKKGLYAGLLGSSAAFAFFCYSLLSWAPTILVRAHGYSTAKAGIALGSVMMPVTIVSIYAWPRLATLIDRRRPKMGFAHGMQLATLVAIVPFITAPVMPTASLFLAGTLGPALLTGAWGTLTPLASQSIAPGWMVARVTALNLLLTNLLGYGAGPMLAVAFGHLWKRSDVPGWLGTVTEPIAWGIATEGALAVIIMLITTTLFARSMRAYIAAAGHAADQTRPGEPD